MQNGKRRFALTNCEGMKWSGAIGLSVVMDDTIELSPAETVAANIWSLTFYGFSEKVIQANVEEMGREMEVGELVHYNPGEDDDEEGEEGKESLSLSPEEEESAEKVEYAMMELLSQSEGLCVKICYICLIQV